jgi:single-stranded-DNA-specific exonuclease
LTARGDSPSETPQEVPWRTPRVAHADVRRLQEALGCPEPMAWILARRGLADPHEARDFLRADGDLADPLRIAGAGEAAARLREALVRGEHVAIHGDYDCDGVCSTAILAGALTARGGEVTTFLPSRFTDGYGVSEATVERLADSGADLLVTVDCGTSSVEPLQRAVELGMDVMVLDHHLAAGARPPGILVNPALGRGMDDLPAAAGVVFDVVRALAAGDDGLLAPAPDEGVDLAGLATVADAVPLIGNNRRLVHRALASIRRGERPGIVALLGAAGQGYRGITPRGLSFTLAPAINAAGRLAEASRALELMLEDDPVRARALAEELWDLNSRRRDVERQVTAEAIAMVEATAPDGVPITLVAGEAWHEGVVGIVASRLVERFGRPAIVLSTDGASAKGSGRSLPGLDLHAIVADASEVLTRWGGHSGAVGVSLATDDIPGFREALERSALGRSADIRRAQTRHVDAVVAGADLTLDTAEKLEALAPFGRGNPEPRIVVPACAVSGLSRVGEGRHLRARLGAGGVTVPAIGFSMGRQAPLLEEAGGDARFDAVAKLEVERWQDTTGARVSLDALDLLPSGPVVPGGCADACDVACHLRRAPSRLAEMVGEPFGPAPPEVVAVPEVVRDHRGEGRALSLICALAGADRGVVAVVADVPRRRAALADVLAPGRLGVDVAVLGGVRCDSDAMRGRLALARGGPVLALLDYAALREVDIPDGVHVVVVDPPTSHDEAGWLAAACADRAAHLTWGPDEAALALRVAEADLAVRDVARSLWPALAAQPGVLAWGPHADRLLAGDGPVVRSPRAVAIALAALADAGLLRVGHDGISVVAGAGQADLQAGPIGRRAAALADEARVMTSRAMTMDVLGSAPEWLPEATGALS